MMKLLMSVSLIFMVTASLMSFALLRNHLVSALLSLECASLTLYFFLFTVISNVPSEMYNSLVFLTLAACEGALGLSLLVAIIKHKGNDYLNTNSLTQC